MSTQRRGPEGHHDWHSQEYVDHWIDHDLTRDDERRPVLRDMMQQAHHSRRTRPSRCWTSARATASCRRRR